MYFLNISLTVAVTGILLALSLATPVIAAETDEPEIQSEAEVVVCGIPNNFDDKSVFLELDPKMDYCDIFTRQIAYRTESMRLKDRLNERRAYYAAPGMQARKNYRDALETLHEERAKTEREKLHKKLSDADSAEPEQSEKTAEMSVEKAGNLVIKSNAAEAGVVKTGLTDAILKKTAQNPPAP
jgi:hypothetical protein